MKTSQKRSVRTPLESRTGLSIRSRTILGYIFIAAITICASILSLQHLNSDRKAIESISQGSWRMQQLAALKISWAGMMSDIDMMLLTRQSSLASSEIPESAEQVMIQLNALSDHYSSQDTENLPGALIEFVNLAYVTVDSICIAAENGHWATAQIIHHTDLASIQRRIEDELRIIRSITASEVLESTAEVTQTQNRMRTGLIIVIILVALLVPVSAILAAASIVKPIEYLASAVRSLKPEGLSQRLVVSRKDEIGELAMAYNSMTERLHHVMNGLESQVEAHRVMREALQESEDRYKNLFQHSAISLWQLCLKSHGDLTEPEIVREITEGKSLSERIQVVDVNKATHELLSTTGSEDIPDMNSVLTSQAREVFTEAFRLFARGEKSFSSETTVKDSNGSIRHVIAHFAVPPDKGGCIRNVFLSLLDVTDRKKMEQALKESEEQYYQAQKMEAVGRLTGGIAHDFNNLLTVIISNCDIALLSNDITSDLTNHLTQIGDAASRAAAVTEQLLAFSRQQVSNPVLLDLNGLVEDVARMLDHLIGENVKLTLELQPGISPVIADAGQMEQVIMNLAVNAKDAMPSGGELIITTSGVVLTDMECRDREHVSPGGYLLLCVSDTGSGMTREVLDRAFDPFFTTKEQGKGTGLGLASVHGIVTNNKGWIDVTSTPGQGTSFKIYLPQGEGEAVETRLSETTGSVNSGSETILLVEDEPGVREIAARAMKLNGYTVIEAEDGDSAFNAFKENSDRIDILISDVVLPGSINGIDIAKVLKTRKPEIGVMLMSGYIQQAVTRSGDLPENAVFLSKPFSINELLRKIRETVESD